MRSTGTFISVEGVEGSGKSTQAIRLAQAIRAGGSKCILTKEPGGTRLGDRIRSILLDPEEDGMDPVTELCLYSASRRQHLTDVIRPGLDQGAVILCDRFTDATLAYQGFGRLLDLGQLHALNDWVTEKTYPDLVLLFDLSESVGLDRARSRNAALDMQNESRLEGEDLRFHRRVREGYLALAASEPHRFSVIDASGSVDEVFARALSELHRRYPALRVSRGPSA